MLYEDKVNELVGQERDTKRLIVKLKEEVKLNKDNEVKKAYEREVENYKNELENIKDEMLKMNTDIKKFCDNFEELDKMKIGIGEVDFKELFLKETGLEDEIKKGDFEFDEDESFYDNLMSSYTKLGHVIRTSLIRAETKLKEIMYEDDKYIEDDEEEIFQQWKKRRTRGGNING